MSRAAFGVSRAAFLWRPWSGMGAPGRVERLRRDAVGAGGALSSRRARAIFNLLEGLARGSARLRVEVLAAALGLGFGVR